MNCAGSVGTSFARAVGRPARATLHVPATAGGNGPLSIRIGDDPAQPVAALDCAGHYESAPDAVALAACKDLPGQCTAQRMSTETFAIPLHPELAHECARTSHI